MPGDRGPIYFETVIGRFPVEPWNTVSNLLFLALIIYWFARVRGDFAAHRFIAYSLPVLLIGWAGGTVYHATRSHNVWLFLDFGPIALLVLAVAVFFWRRQGVAWRWVPALVFGPAALIFPLMVAIPDPARPFVGYGTLALSILLPVTRYLAGTRWVDLSLVAAALAVFAMAIAFRGLDARMAIAFLPMGTHWLWHSLGAGAVHLFILLIFRSDLRETTREFQRSRGQAGRAFPQTQ